MKPVLVSLTLLVLLIAGVMICFIIFHRPGFDSTEPLSLVEAARHTDFHFPDGARAIMVSDRSVGPGHFNRFISFQADSTNVAAWLAATTNTGGHPWSRVAVDPHAPRTLGKTPPWFDIGDLDLPTVYSRAGMPIQRIWIDDAGGRVLVEEAD